MHFLAAIAVETESINVFNAERGNGLIRKIIIGNDEMVKNWTGREQDQA